jgi:hypothetical protein
VITPEILHVREVVQNVRSGRDRIAAVKQFLFASLRGDHSHRDGFVAGDLAIQTRRELGLGNLILLVEKLAVSPK